MKEFIKKFIAVNLTLFVFINCLHNFAFSLGVKVEKKASSEISFKYHKPESAYPWHDENMTCFCLGVVEAKLKNPDNLLENTEIQLELRPEPLCYGFNPFDLSSFLQETPKRKNVNTFKINGPLKRTDWYRFVTRFINYILDNRVNVQYRLVELSKDEAKIFTEKKVKEGQKKKELADDEALNKAIEEQNGKSKMADFANKIVQRAIDGLNNPNVDPHDPYNVVENAKIFDYGNYKENITVSSYFNKKEADEKNKETIKKIKKKCQEFANMSGEDLKGYGEICTLNPKKDTAFFAIIVNNNIVDEEANECKSDAYKMSKLFAYHGSKAFNGDKSMIEISAKKIFTMPEEGVPFDQTKVDEIDEEVQEALQKPGFVKWTKEKIGKYFDLLKILVPKYIADGVEAICDKIFKKDNSKKYEIIYDDNENNDDGNKGKQSAANGNNQPG